MTVEYNVSDKYSIEKYAQGMVGKTFRQLCELSGTDADKWDNTRQKGGVGSLVEVEFFHYENNSESEPDFAEAGVELKTTPYIKKGDALKAKERLSLTMINYMDIVKDDVFENSHFWRKCRLILLVYYQYLRELNKLDNRITFARLWTPSEQDLRQIKADYKKIVDKVKAGLAHELSESDTMYLAAATKGSDSSATRPQPYSDIPAKYRGFAYKQSYMTYVLNTYIRGKRPLYESIIGDEVVDDIEEYIIRKINEHIGQDTRNICKDYGINIEKKPKNLYSLLTFKMLGIKGNQAEEFVKANIVVKTIRVEVSGKIEQHMSFPTFKFCELAIQDWEESDFYRTLSETRFLFVIYQKTEEGEMYLKKAMFWAMPTTVLENEVRPVWEKTKDVLKKIEEVNELHNGSHYISIFPRQSESDVCHVRPHGRDSSDTDILPDGRCYPKQCFWLDRKYIKQIISEE